MSGRQSCSVGSEWARRWPLDLLLFLLMCVCSCLLLLLMMQRLLWKGRAESSGIGSSGIGDCGSTMILAMFGRGSKGRRWVD